LAQLLGYCAQRANERTGRCSAVWHALSACASTAEVYAAASARPGTAPASLEGCSGVLTGYPNGTAPAILAEVGAAEVGAAVTGARVGVGVPVVGAVVLYLAAAIRHVAKPQRRLIVRACAGVLVRAFVRAFVRACARIDIHVSSMRLRAHAQRCLCARV
jgi:hypothetical protein